MLAMTLGRSLGTFGKIVGRCNPVALNSGRCAEQVEVPRTLPFKPSLRNYAFRGSTHGRSPVFLATRGSQRVVHDRCGAPAVGLQMLGY